MTPELSAFFDRAAAAERVGDVDEALMYHSSIPMFRRSRHRAMLQQLAAARGDLTSWVAARWIVYQALRCEDPGSCTGRRLLGALRDGVETFHLDLLEAAYVEGSDPVRPTAEVMGESWAHHQLAAYDYGVLAAFLDEFVGGELVEGAALARSWLGARMGGYRLEGPTSPGSLTVRDLADDRTIEVLDLGAACTVGPAGTVIGRLVPSGTAPALLFDTAPMPVDERIATDVARCQGRAEWAEVLQWAIDERRIDPEDLLREDYELMSDIPSWELLKFGTRPTDLARVTAQLQEGRDEIGRAAFRVLRLASLGTLDDDAAPYVAAACLNARAHEHAHKSILAAGQQRQWLRWAALVPAPARTRLLRFAEATADAA
jgi:hypothetical protein